MHNDSIIMQMHIQAIYRSSVGPFRLFFLTPSKYSLNLSLLATPSVIIHTHIKGRRDGPGVDLYNLHEDWDLSVVYVSSFVVMHVTRPAGMLEGITAPSHNIPAVTLIHHLCIN